MVLRGVHSNYVADLLGRRTRTASAQSEEQRAETALAQQLIGERFKATLAIEDDGERFIESHSVRIDAVAEHSDKVCFVFKRYGQERSLIMRANQALKHLPTKFHLMEVAFISPRALEILKKLPHSGDAEDEMVICCEEVLYLMDSIDFETDRVLQGAMSDQE